MSYFDVCARALCTAGLTLAVAGCQSGSQPPWVWVHPNSGPSRSEKSEVNVWSPEKEERLKEAQRELEQVKQRNQEVANKLRNASEDEIQKLNEERNRLKERVLYLRGEIKALTDDKTGRGGYTVDGK